jgi:pimeloyl-ACP methyl ester carboxylesterase
MSHIQAKKTYQVPFKDGYVTWHEFGSSNSFLPLVLLHGGHGSWEHWSRNIDVLAEHFHLYAPDMPGFGQSSFFDNQLQSGMIDPLKSTLDSLIGVNQALNVAGFSFGGFVTAHLVNQRIGINKIALLGSAGHGGPRRPRGELVAWKDFYIHHDWEGLHQAMRENLYQQMISTREGVDSEALRIHESACIATRFKSKPIARPGGLAEQLEEYKGATLLVWGEHDVTCTPEYLIDKLVTDKSNRQKALIEDSGHWVQYEKAAEVNQLLVDWFK